MPQRLIKEKKKKNSLETQLIPHRPFFPFRILLSKQ